MEGVHANVEDFIYLYSDIGAFTFDWCFINLITLYIITLYTFDYFIMDYYSYAHFFV